MAGTKEGGLLAAQTNIKKYGPDFYQKIGAKGGSNGRTGGFAANRWCDKPCPYDELLGDHMVKQCAGVKGGRKSRRTYITKGG